MLKKTAKDYLKKPMINFSDPNVWIKFAMASIKTQSTNMGQGFPDWGPPGFFNEFLKKNIDNPNANHQYNRAFGVPHLVNSLANDYSRYFNKKIDPLNEITVSTGGSAILYNAFTSLLNPGDEVVVIEPFYECYLPQANFSYAKVKGVPLIPPKKRPASAYADVTQTNLKSSINDHWQFDFKRFEETLTEKTKIVIINSPNNPTGTIYSMEELTEMARIINKKAPNAICISDEVYEHIYYDNHTTFPRMANVPGMWDKTLSVYSAGKIFSCTGIRIGWAVGAEPLIKSLNVNHQYNAFCMYEPIQNTIADCLNECDKPYQGFDNYFEWYRNTYNVSRNALINGLSTQTKLFTKPEYKMDFWMPEGAYFVVGDVSDAKVKQEYLLDGDEGKTYTQDYAYTVNFVNKVGVTIIPLSIFYTPENRHHGENFIRFSFCKKLSTIEEAVSKFNKI